MASNTPCSISGKCVVIDHPLVRARVTALRSAETGTADFRRLLWELSIMVAYEALRDLDVDPKAIRTPLAEYEGCAARRSFVVVPILRAGLGMAEGIVKILPEATVGHIGMFRDEITLLPQHYYFRLPPGTENSEVLLVDPMLATGHSAADAAHALKKAGVRHLRLLNIVASEPGRDHFLSQHPDVPIYTASLDPGLNEHGYIVPGLGDAGDRYFGT